MLKMFFELFQQSYEEGSEKIKANLALALNTVFNAIEGM
jgi:hypothetical protein